MKKAYWIFLLAVISSAAAVAQQDPPAETAKPSEAKMAEASMVIPPGAKIFVAPMTDSFDDYMKKAIEAKKVPVTVVESRDQADFEITGSSESKKAGAAKVIIMGSWHSKETASIKVENLKSGTSA